MTQCSHIALIGTEKSRNSLFNLVYLCVAFSFTKDYSIIIIYYIHYLARMILSAFISVLSSTYLES